MSVKIDDVIVAYIAMRDKKAAMKAKYTAEVAAVDDKMGALEAFLLKEMRAKGVTEFGVRGIGTAYCTQQTSATIGEWDSFLEFVKHKELWNLLEHRCAKTAVLEYKGEHNELPPGINYTVIDTVNIRRK